MPKPNSARGRHMADLTQALVLQCFRNPLEHLHGGDFPSTRTGDYSDVKVVTPDGEIPWNSLQRISDDEMRDLIMEVVDLTFTALLSVNNSLFVDGFLAYASETKILWKRPEFRKAFVKTMEEFARLHARDPDQIS